MSRPVYEREYFTQLGELSPRRVWDDLVRLAGGAEPVILCFEKPPFNEGNWCHRRMVAQWFEATLGEKVPELNFDGADLALSVSPRVGRDI
jgi:hypothetical protein